MYNIYPRGALKNMICPYLKGEFMTFQRERMKHTRVKDRSPPDRDLHKSRGMRAGQPR